MIGLSMTWFFQALAWLKITKPLFNSHIKRKGIESLIAKASKTLRKHTEESCPVCIAMKLKKSVVAAN